MMTQVPQASCKAVLLVLLVLLVAGRAAEISETQVEGQMEKRSQGQHQTLIKLLKSLQARVVQLEARGGVQYVRWGKTICPWGASLVYKGYIGGDYYDHTGGGSNYLCLPENPRYGRYRSGYQFPAMVYGTEYEISYFNPFSRNLHNHDAPCAVCYVRRRSTKLMIPATYVCPTGWTREYHGYLMTERFNHAHSSNYICVDQYAEAVPGTKADRYAAQLYPVEGRCGTLPCYPYVGGRELTCAVCTK